MDGLTRGLIDDPGFYQIMMRDLEDGQHRNPTGAPEYFTTAFFHTPDELEDEIAEAGFALIETVAVQGPAWMFPDFDKRWTDDLKRRSLMDLLRTIDHEHGAMWMSPHMMAVASK